MSSKMRKIIKKFFIAVFILGHLILAYRSYQSLGRLVSNEPVAIYAFKQSSYIYQDASNVKYGYNPNHKIRSVSYIIVHSTDNPDADNYAHIKWLNRNKKSNAVHYYVDAIGVTKALDESIQAWGVGDGDFSKTTIRNSNSIQIEICEYSDSVLQQQAINNAILFIQTNLLKRHPQAQIVKHQDASDKNCPRILLKDKNSWTDFLANIRNVRL